LLSNQKSEITSEKIIGNDVILFKPYFIQFDTPPNSIYFSSWNRIGEIFFPDLKELLNFRDIRTGKWDPAMTVYYDLGKISTKILDIPIFIGYWMEPTRSKPRVKVFYPNEELLVQAKYLELPFRIENNGDVDIDMYKIEINSPLFKTDLIEVGENLKFKESKQFNFRQLLKDVSGELSGKITLTLWKKGEQYQQFFELKGALKEILSPKDKEKEKQIQVKKMTAEELKRIFSQLNLYLEFVNHAIETGISGKMLEKLRSEMDEFERKLKKKNQ
jgi:hypothetical protein